MSIILKNCKLIITQDEKRKVLKNKDILIEENEIIQIGKNLKGKEKINCSKKIVLPGLINTHTHLGMHSLKGACDDKELFEWLEKIKNQEEKLNAKKIKENTKNGLEEAIRFGTTTIYDSYKHPQERAEAFKEAGIRGVLSATVKDKKTLKESKSFLAGLKGDKIIGAIAANSIYNCEKEILEKVIEYSNEKQLLRRIHVGETRGERFEIQKKSGKLAIEYLDSIGFLSPLALLVHCIWITKGEIKLIAKTKTKISHNPVSNMKLASGGVMPLVEMLEEKVTVGLGTDSVVSNNNLDMFEEMKTCALLHKHHKWDASAISAQTILDMATREGARCLGLEKAGAIKKGWKADLITLNLDRNLTPLNDAVSSIIYSSNGLNVNDSICNGKILMKDKSIDFRT